MGTTACRRKESLSSGRTLISAIVKYWLDHRLWQRSGSRTAVAPFLPLKRMQQFFPSPAQPVSSSPGDLVAPCSVPVLRWRDEQPKQGLPRPPSLGRCQQPQAGWRGDCPCLRIGTSLPQPPLPTPGKNVWELWYRCLIPNTDTRPQQTLGVLGSNSKVPSTEKFGAQLCKRLPEAVINEDKLLSNSEWAGTQLKAQRYFKQSCFAKNKSKSSYCGSADTRWLAKSHQLSFNCVATLFCVGQPTHQPRVHIPCSCSALEI